MLFLVEVENIQKYPIIFDVFARLPEMLLSFSFFVVVLCQMFLGLPGFYLLL
jgi:hypothetical protein